MRRAVLMISVALILFSGIGATGLASAYSYVPPFHQAVSIPSYSFTNESMVLYVNDTYGFSNYTLTIYAGGNNVTGMSPIGSFHTFQATNPDFKVNFTAPEQAQTVYFTIISVANYGASNVSSKANYQLKIISPLVFHAEVTNKGTNPIHNLTLDFYLDGATLPIGDVVIPTLLPNQVVVANLTYPFQSMGSGEHTLKVTTQSPLVSINGNTGSSTSNFYYGTPPNYTWIYYIAAIVVVFMIFMALSSGRRPPAGSRPPKWRNRKKDK